MARDDERAPGGEPPAEAGAVTELLARWSEGDARAEAPLLEAVYRELRNLASAYLARERSGHTLQPTALVHEAYLKLLGQRHVDWKNRGHFFGIAAQQMRRILIDHARRRLYAKRGGGAVTVSLDGLGHEPMVVPDWKLLAVDTALTRLAAHDAAKAKLVELRFFGGLTVPEVCAVAGISPATYHRHWALAKAWLQKALSASEPDGEPGAHEP